MAADRKDVARAAYEAFAAADREAIERILADDFTMSTPADPQLDRAGYFERCWPGAGDVGGFEFVRMAELGDDEVLVTYEAQRAGKRFRNTEVLTIRAGRLVHQEVYWGWDL